MIRPHNFISHPQTRAEAVVGKAVVGQTHSGTVIVAVARARGLGLVVIPIT